MSKRYIMYFLGFFLQSDWNLCSMISARVTPGKSCWCLSALKGQSFCILYAICIESFCNCIFTAISHNIVRTLSFWTLDDFLQFQIPCCFLIFYYYYIGTAGPKHWQCVSVGFTVVGDLELGCGEKLQHS